MTSPLATVLFLSTCLLFPVEVRGDYPCLCNYQIEVPMLSRPDNQSQPLGSMYEFDCFAQVQTQMPVPDDSWVTLAYQHQVAYVHKELVEQQICPGHISEADALTTTATPVTSAIPTTTETTTSTTPTTVTTPTQKVTPPSTTPLTTTMATDSTTQMSTTSTVKSTDTTQLKTTLHTLLQGSTTKSSGWTLVPWVTHTYHVTTTNPTHQHQHVSTSTSQGHGDLSLCPGHLTRGHRLNDLRQYRNSCYELVKIHDDWAGAKTDCHINSGHLVHIGSEDVQMYLVNFLRESHFNHPVWIGLNDMHSEGHFHWISGQPVTYTNWMQGHTGNTAPDDQEDCVLMTSYTGGGKWYDVTCHGFMMNMELYPWICEYSIFGHHG